MPEHRWIKYSLLTLSILGPCLILAIAIRKKMSKRDRFISEDDLETFGGFLRYHVIDPSMTSPDELQKWRELFDEARQRIAASPKVGRMKFKFDPVRREPELQRFYRRKLIQKGLGKARVAVARKLGIRL